MCFINLCNMRKLTRPILPVQPLYIFLPVGNKRTMMNNLIMLWLTGVEDQPGSSLTCTQRQFTLPFLRKPVEPPDLMLLQGFLIVTYIYPPVQNVKKGRIRSRYIKGSLSWKGTCIRARAL